MRKREVLLSEEAISWSECWCWQIGDILLWAVQRPLNIEVEAQDGAGQKVSLSLSGWKARIFQHGEHCSCSCVGLPMLLSIVVRVQASLGAMLTLPAAENVADTGNWLVCRA